MPNGLYERDALAWAEQQAALLRRLAAGEGVSEAVDWPNVIEELQDVGLSELRACRSLLQQAMGHLLKLYALPDCQDATHWRDEAGTFLDDAEQRFTPSMRQRIDLDELYAKALRRARVVLADSNVPSRTLPEVCPFLMSESLLHNRLRERRDDVSWCVSVLTGLVNHDSIVALPRHGPRDGASFS